MRISIVLVLTVLVVFSTCPAFAQEDNIGTSIIYPASPFYFLKTIREGLELKFALTPHSKMLRQLEFATRRLREVKTLLSKDEELIPPTLEKYNFYISLFPENLGDQNVSERIKESLVIHLKTLQEIYTQVSSARSKIAIRSTLYKIIKRADVPDYAKLPVCSLFAKEASSSALNDTEKKVYLERSKTCI